MKKRILAILTALAMLTLTACGNTPVQQTPTEAEQGERTEEYENICVDIGVNEDGYYGLMSNVSIHYDEDGTLGWISVLDPVLLAFNVSSESGGGVYVINLPSGEKAIDELSSVAEALKAAGMTEYAERIDAVIAIITSGGPYTQAST